MQKYIKWLNELGFEVNPFQLLDREQDNFNCFIDPIHFDRMMEPRSSLIIGKEGWGKTVCRRLLENQLRKEKQFTITLEEKDLPPSETASKEASVSHYIIFVNAVIQKIVPDLLEYLFYESKLFESILAEHEPFKAIIRFLDFNFISSLIDQQIFKKTGLMCNDIVKANRDGALKDILNDRTEKQQSKIRLCSKLIRIHKEGKRNPYPAEIYEELYKVINTVGFRALCVFIDGFPQHYMANLAVNLASPIEGIYYKILHDSKTFADESSITWDIIEIEWPFEKKNGIIEEKT